MPSIDPDNTEYHIILSTANIFARLLGTVGHKIHDPCFYKKYMKAGVRTFVAHSTSVKLKIKRRHMAKSFPH